MEYTITTTTPEQMQLANNQTQLNMGFGFLLFFVVAFSIIAYFHSRFKRNS